MIEDVKGDSFSLELKLKTDLSSVYKRLLRVKNLYVLYNRDEGKVLAGVLESVDARKRPLKFMLFEFDEDSVEVAYTFLEDEFFLSRKLKAIRTLVSLLEVLRDDYEITPEKIFALIENYLENFLRTAKEDYKKLMNEFAIVQSQYEELLRKLEMYEEENERLKHEIYRLKIALDEAQLKLKSYEKLSDGAIKEKLYEWIVERNGEINLWEFSEFYKVPIRKVEKLLEELVNDGYLQPR